MSARAAALRSLPGDAKLLCWIVAMRAGLTLLGYRRLRRLIPSAPAGGASPHHARRVARRIEALARLVPGATCLTQALALSGTLARQGHATTIRIGVSRPGQRRAERCVNGATAEGAGFEAHAWVECAGHVVLGHRRVDLAGFTPIASLH